MKSVSFTSSGNLLREPFASLRFPEPLPLREPTQGTYGSPNPSLHGGNKLSGNCARPEKGRGSGNRRFPE